MQQSTLRQFNETDRLKKVIIGRWEDYCSDKSYVEIVNEEQKKGLPDANTLSPEFKAFKQTLEDYGIEVLVPQYVGKFVYDQLTPRDIGITIGEKFVVCNMAKKSRRYEVTGVFPFINAMNGDEPSILVPDHSILLEGGDIIVDNGHIFVGISQRTNVEGFEYLKKHFGEEFSVIPVYCRSLSEGENVLHLDCAFNPVGEHHALIYTDGFKEIPNEIKEHYHLIEVSVEEQAELATNVISLDKNTVISRDHEKCRRVNNLMRAAGIKVIELTFNGAPSTGGSFRCCTLPLVRE
ncbi:arginine deiminase family protein [Fulvivirga ulvae]|uniref:dimethylarginine dimethylaminohydrolase family protein n=1 Tax=Fulvivirga ulvae TaxID=2904245 RepID=UPI001F2EAA43|nr:arginine deiminase family protein [Fulvivirga ulvae]UII33061.1 arginine deiminase family protein [Fulvivirga ulvae]